MEQKGSGTWKVLIADDEQMICRLIQKLIPWETLHLELVKTAENGLDAIAYLKQKDADILITDARMPECDGIELVKWCRQNRPGMRAIVISGFREFEYAHGALQYGVDKYLLKPINQEELIQALQGVCARLEERNEAHSIQNQQLRQLADRNRDRMRRHFISSYIFDGKNLLQRDISSVSDINEEYQMNFSEGIYRAVFIKIDDPQHTQFRLEEFMERIKTEAEKAWGDYLTENVGCTVHSGVIFFLNYAEREDARVRENLEKLFKACEHMLDMVEGVRITIGVSHPERTLQGLHSCMVTAADAIKYRLYLPHVSIIYYDSYKYETVPVGQIWSAARARLLENHMYTGNEKGVQKLMFDLKLDLHQNKDLSPVVVYDAANTVGSQGAELFEKMVPGNPDKDRLYEEFLMQMDNRQSVDGIIESLENLLLQYMRIMSIEMKQQEIQPIRLIREFVDQHYAEPISLDDVAEKVHLSRNYVSAIFKKETGVNFLDFLTAKRIEEAANLLRKTDLSISAIAEKVGYADVKYFSKLCKKELGMNPSEYRKLYS